MGSRRQIDELLPAGALDGTEPIETYFDFTPYQTTSQDIANLGVLTTTTLTDGATVGWDTAEGRLAELTLTGSRTMAAPTNTQDGLRTWYAGHWYLRQFTAFTYSTITR